MIQKQVELNYYGQSTAKHHLDHEDQKSSNFNYRRRLPVALCATVFSLANLITAHKITRLSESFCQTNQR